MAVQASVIRKVWNSRLLTDVRASKRGLKPFTETPNLNHHNLCSLPSISSVLSQFYSERLLQRQSQNILSALWERLLWIFMPKDNVWLEVSCSKLEWVLLHHSWEIGYDVCSWRQMWLDEVHDFIEDWIVMFVIWPSNHRECGGVSASYHTAYGHQ